MSDEMYLPLKNTMSRLTKSTFWEWKGRVWLDVDLLILYLPHITAQMCLNIQYSYPSPLLIVNLICTEESHIIAVRALVQNETHAWAGVLNVTFTKISTARFIQC